MRAYPVEDTLAALSCPTTHGVDGWMLVEFEWDEATGLGVAFYERDVRDARGQRETRTVVRRQPTLPRHVGYDVAAAVASGW